MTSITEVVIIGGGVIGTSILYYLTKRGKKVTLIEKGDLAFGASGACDQCIILQSKSPGIHLKMAMESAQIYKSLKQELDHPIEYKETGGMILIETEEELEVMKDFVKRQQETGLEVELIDRETALKYQPGLAEHLIGSTHSPHDAHVNSLELTIGFAKAAHEKGAELLLHTEVTGIKEKNGKVTGVKTTRGDISCEVVVICAGAWAPIIGQMVGIEIPIKPRQGQIIVTEETPPFVRGGVLSAKYIASKYNPDSLQKSAGGVGLSLSQTAKGNIFIGATRDFIGYSTDVTRENMKKILKNAARLVPGLKEINIIRMFSGLRPYTPDGLPIMGPVDELEGFFTACGHEGDGLALSPVTGKIMSDLIIDEKTFMDIKKLNINRFNKNFNE